MASLLRSAVAAAVRRPPSVDEVMGFAARGETAPLAHYRKFWSWLSTQSPEAMERARAEADLFFVGWASRLMSTVMSRAPSG